MGKFEIEKLKKRFAPKMGLKNFHDCLLKEGQIPFGLARIKMEKLCGKNS